MSVRDVSITIVAQRLEDARQALQDARELVDMDQVDVADSEELRASAGELVVLANLLRLRLGGGV